MDAIQRNLEYFQSLRKNREEFINDVTEKSDDLKKYSRDQFDYSLNNNDPSKVIQCFRKSSLQDIYNEKTNGPSKSGSPIHNSRAKIMNSIRTRPRTGAKYSTHERSSRYSGITNTINNSNAEYTVIKSIPIPGMTKPDFILIPTANSLEEKAPFYDPAILNLDKMSLSQGGTRPNTNYSARTGLISRQSVPRIMLQTGSPIPDSPAPSPEPPKDAKGKSASKKAADSNSKNNKVKKKPKCWVDTATISDIIDENSKGRSKNQNSKNAKKKKKMEEEMLIVTLDDIQDEELPLPDYICPSSADKSKEAAIRNWLKETKFTTANKTLPLL
ncbi:unnamed protein product [Owenia fusiformis]|nr:unnamed protein product [Owenia fusiformis]